MATRYLTGVVQDGGRTAPGVPYDPRTTLTLVQGGSYTLRVRVVRSSGAPVALAGGTVTLTARRSPRDTFPLLAVDADLSPELGQEWATVDLSPDATAGIRSGTYCWDVWWQDALGGREPVIPISPLVIQGAVGTGTGAAVAEPTAAANIQKSIPGVYAIGTLIAYSGGAYVPADRGSVGRARAIGVVVAFGSTTSVIQETGYVSAFSGLTSGQPIYVGINGGYTQTRTTTPGTFMSIFGVATGAGTARIDPSDLIVEIA